MSRSARIGIILAGGRSSRMGKDKAMVSLGGLPLLRRAIDRLEKQVDAIAISSNDPAAIAENTAIDILADTLPGHLGPMAGILAGLRYASLTFPAATHVATAATDTPFFPRDLVTRLEAAAQQHARIAVATCAGRLHPVFALWPVTIADDLENWLQTDDKRRVRSFLERHSMIEVDFPVIAASGVTIDPFFNINTPAELEEAERWLPRLETETR